MAQVSFICKRTVVSTKTVQIGKLSPLSVLDRVMEHSHLRVVLYYNSAIKTRATGELTKNLRESISEMLSSFPVVRGRLLKTPEVGHWMIKCNDAGLRMVEAKVNATVDEWLQNVDRENELKLAHWEDMTHTPYFWSPFYVQITEFEGGGLAVGLSCTHMLSDPICAAMMIKAWADTTLFGQIKSPPSFDALPSPQTSPINEKNTDRRSSLISHYKSALENSSPTSDAKQTTITLHFNQEAVRSCIAMAGNRNHTPFEALAALFWTRVSKAKGKKRGLVDMSICLDMRKVLGLEKGFFGNCMVCNKVVQRDDGSDENEVAKAAAFIEEAVAKMGRDDVMEVVEWLESEKCEKINPLNSSDLICVNLESVDWYSAVFEDNATPLRVSCYVEPAVGTGRILILPAPEGDGGRVVQVTVAEDEGEKLPEDALIKQFDPTILMRLNKKLA